MKNSDARPTKQETTEQDLEAAIEALAGIARFYRHGTVRRIHVELAHSADVGYQVELIDEEFPLVGSVSVPPQRRNSPSS